MKVFVRFALVVLVIALSITHMAAFAEGYIGYESEFMNDDGEEYLRTFVDGNGMTFEVLPTDPITLTLIRYTGENGDLVIPDQIDCIIYYNEIEEGGDYGEFKNIKVTEVAREACKGNKKLKSLTVGKNVKIIRKNAFSGCKNLKTVTLGKGLKTIGENAFYKCTSLTKLILPPAVYRINKQAFFGCKKLKTIKIKTGYLTKEYMGKDAFKGIHKKAKITCPKSKLAKYKKILTENGGVPKTVKIKK